MNKEVDVDMRCSNVKKDKKMLMRIKEFDNLRRALTQMLHEQFRYVSYIYGGFYEIHSFSMKYNVNLLGHGSECYLCAKEKGRPQSLLSFFSKLMSNKPKQKKEKEPTPNTNIFDAKPELTVDEISKLILNPFIKQYTCLYRSDFDILPSKNSDSSSTDSSETTLSSSSNHIKDITIMLFLTKKKIMIYQENKEPGREVLNYILIRDIEITKIKTISQKNQAGNIITLNYVENSEDTLFMTIDFVSDIDSRDFRKSVRRVMQRNSLGK